MIRSAEEMLEELYKMPNVSDMERNYVEARIHQNDALQRCRGYQDTAMEHAEQAYDQCEERTKDALGVIYGALMCMRQFTDEAERQGMIADVAIEDHSDVESH